jgi:hypothetical protein
MIMLYIIQITLAAKITVTQGKLCYALTSYSFVPGLVAIPVQNTGPEVTAPSISGHRT